MKEVLLSIIVPVYNVEKYIKPCIHSLIGAIDKAPEYTYEIIIVDDCGQDKSIQKVQKLQEKHPELIRIVYHKENKGLGGARNTGIEEAKGQFIQFMDSDDWIHEKMYAKLIPTLIENPKKIAVFGIEAVKNKKKLWDIHPTQKGIQSAEKVMNMISRDELNVSACNKIFPKTLFANHRFTERMIYEDLDLIPLVFEKSNGAYFVQKNYYFYRQEGESLTRTATSDKHLSDGITATKRLFLELKSELTKGNILLNRWAYFLGKWNLSNAQKGQVVNQFIEVLSSIEIKAYDDDQGHKFLKKINKLEKDLGKEKLLELKFAFIQACNRSSEKQYPISIISPVYNNENYLDRFIKSLDQNFEGFYELIFVDDLSEDKSFDLIKIYAENKENISAYQLPKKGGAGGARNFGIEKANGSYITFLDSDDWVSEDFFEEIIDSIIINIDADMVLFGFNIVDQENEISWSSTKIFNLPFFNYSGEQVFQMFLDEIVNPSPWNKVIHHSLIEKNKARFPEHIYHQDLAYIPFLFHQSEKISLIKKPLYNYFVNSEGITQTATQKHIDSVFQAVDHLIELVVQSDKKSNTDDLIKMALLNYNYNLQMRKEAYSDEQILNFKEQLVKTFKKLEVNIYHIIYNFHGRELFANLKLEFDSRGMEFSLSEAILNVDIDDLIDQFTMIYHQANLSMGGTKGPHSSFSAGSPTEVQNLKNALAWYERTYDHLPKWYLKPGGVFRRKPFNKLKKKN